MNRLILWTYCVMTALLLSMLPCVNEHILRNADAQRCQNAFLTLACIASPAASSDCISARNLLEGVYGCLGDVPGGYCYHGSCDIVAMPSLPHDEYVRIEIEKAK